MDDVYQYAPSAAVSDNNSEQPKEDAISRALTNFSFSQSWNSLVDTVKKQVSLPVLFHHSVTHVLNCF